MTNCFYRGNEYSPGSMECHSDKRVHKCNNDGVWTLVGGECETDQIPSVRTCCEKKSESQTRK